MQQLTAIIRFIRVDQLAKLSLATTGMCVHYIRLMCTLDQPRALHIRPPSRAFHMEHFWWAFYVCKVAQGKVPPRLQCIQGGWLVKAGTRANKLKRTRSRGQAEKSPHAAAYCPLLPSRLEIIISSSSSSSSWLGSWSSWSALWSS